MKIKFLLGLILWGFSLIAFSQKTRVKLNHDGTLNDIKTSLMWSVDYKQEARTFAEAKAVCDTLVYAGYFDWRLPTKGELVEFISYALLEPTLNEFIVIRDTNTMSLYWTSSPHVQDSDKQGSFMLESSDPLMETVTPKGSVVIHGGAEGPGVWVVPVRDWQSKTNAQKEATPSYDSTIWLLQAQIVHYASISEIPKPELSPRYRSNAGVSALMTGFTTFEEAGNPLFVLITITNNSNSDLFLPLIPLLSDVRIETESDKKTPLGIRSFLYGLGGPWLSQIEMEGEGEIEIAVDSSETVELLYMVPRFEGEAVIRVSDIGKVRIQSFTGE